MILGCVCGFIVEAAVVIFALSLGLVTHIWNKFWG